MQTRSIFLPLLPLLLPHLLCFHFALQILVAIPLTQIRHKLEVVNRIYILWFSSPQHDASQCKIFDFLPHWSSRYIFDSNCFKLCCTIHIFRCISHLYKRVCPSVGPSIWPCVRYASSQIPSIHLKSPTNHPRPFLDASSHLYKRVCPSVRPSVRLLCLFKNRT